MLRMKTGDILTVRRFIGRSPNIIKANKSSSLRYIYIYIYIVNIDLSDGYSQSQNYINKRTIWGSNKRRILAWRSGSSGWLSGYSASA